MISSCSPHHSVEEDTVTLVFASLQYTGFQWVDYNLNLKLEGPSHTRWNGLLNFGSMFKLVPVMSKIYCDCFRPPSGLPQPTKSEKGNGEAKAATPVLPPRSAAVRKLDELLDGLRSSSSSISNQLPKNETRKATTVQGGRPPSIARDVTARVRIFPNPLFIQLELHSHFVARIHALSEYTTICSSCGLVLCALQPPHCLCSRCSSAFLVLEA
jgi:hypothetical protein